MMFKKWYTLTGFPELKILHLVVLELPLEIPCFKGFSQKLLVFWAV